MIIRPQDFYILAIKLFILITSVPIIFGFIGGLFKLDKRRAFFLGVGWWILIEIAIIFERKAFLFWKELFWIISETSRPSLEWLIGIAGLIFSIMLAGTIASAFAKLGNRLVGVKKQRA